MIDRTALLDALKPVLLNLEKDLRARSDAEPTIKAKLTAQYEAARASRRTAEAYSVWRDELVTQIAVAWVLGTVFIRFLEDNELLDHLWISGPGERRTAAEHEREEYFRTNKLHSDRDYLEHVFRTAAGLPGLSHLFDPKHNPLWQFGPTGDAVTKLLRFWQERNPDTGVLNHDFTDPAWDTRFLGDLYQDLSEAARKRYALLQTPLFIEEFILDRTLDPAIQTFGLKGIRMIDPTCGSGHFVLGGFDRVLRLWQQAEPATPIRELAQRALDSVFGVDLNPFAVGIARFRLLIAALKVVGVDRLKAAPNFSLNLAVGDSLLHGRRFGEFELQGATQRTFDTDDAVFRDELKHHYEVEDTATLRRILGQQYHAVVGNPPYIAVKDSALKGAYKNRYPSCAGKWVLVVPFIERFFDLTVRGDGRASQPAGFMGQITGNNFMKREFGKKLIEEYLPRWDLTHVLDTAGAYIPGHGTPTVILFGRNQRPVSETIRTVLGIRGEPTEPADPTHGKVWQAIVRQIDLPGSNSEWMSSADSPRTAFIRHPWSIGGGGASALKDDLDNASEQELGQFVDQLRGKPNIGITAFTLEDDAFIQPFHVLRRQGLDYSSIRTMIEGDTLRDWIIHENDSVVWPYQNNFNPIGEDLRHPALRLLWLSRTNLANSVLFGNQTKVAAGLHWYEFGRLTAHKLVTPLSISWGEQATHNHFVLDRGGSVFKNSAQVIKLKPGAAEADHFAILGLLNSSTVCFWLKQVCQPKGTVTGDISSERGRPEANRYSFNASAVAKIPLPDLTSGLAIRVSQLAAMIDHLARRMTDLEPRSLLARYPDSGVKAAELSKAFHDAALDHAKTKARAVMLQEEVDWTVYELYELCEGVGTNDIECVLTVSGIAPSLRPFLWKDRQAPPSVPLELKDIYERRRILLEGSPLRLIENEVCKRPWLGRQGVYGSAPSSYAEKQTDALRGWLLERIERVIGRDLNALGGRETIHANQPLVELLTTQQISDLVLDPAFREAAEIYRGRADFDPHKLVAELIQNAAVPFLPGQRYKETGLRKRVVWEETWDKQRAEDAIDDELGLNAPNLSDADRKRLEADAKARKAQRIGDIPVPPKYASTDFRSSVFWSLRGKLDVPKERFISYPGCSRDGDPSLTVAWAGLDHLQQAKALAAHYGNLQSTGAGQPKLLLVLAGLNELLPWLKQWHNQLDPEFGLKMGDYYEEYVREEAKRCGKSLADLKQIAMSTT
jgi:hypothetical protein